MTATEKLRDHLLRDDPPSVSLVRAAQDEWDVERAELAARILELQEEDLSGDDLLEDLIGD
jgi:hypothetical protein